MNICLQSNGRKTNQMTLLQILTSIELFDQLTNADSAHRSMCLIDLEFIHI